MHLNSIIIVVLTAGMFIAIAFAVKEPFKINKLNVIYSKAQHSLGPGKLKDLQNDLKKHELDELNLKKLKANNQDKDGLVEASVRKKLLTIMKKYSLERHFDAIHGMNPLEDAKLEYKEAISKGKLVETPTFRDSKLDKLWKKAEKAGFDQEQLMILHEEFQHQQDKLDEHYRTANMLAEELDKASTDDEKVRNSVEHSETKATYKKSGAKKQKDQPVQKKARIDANLEQALKEKHKAIKEGYEELHERIKHGVVANDKLFKEDRVNDLWSIASRSNFTVEELESLKEELEHYQTRIQKLKHFQNQLERHKIGAKDHSSNADDDDDSKHIRKKVDELSYKVKKAHQTIVSKIVKDEL